MLSTTQDPAPESCEPASWNRATRSGVGVGVEAVFEFRIPCSSRLQDLVPWPSLAPMDSVVGDPIVRLALLTPIADGWRQADRDAVVPEDPSGGV